MPVNYYCIISVRALQRPVFEGWGGPRLGIGVCALGDLRELGVECGERDGRGEREGRWKMGLC